MEEDIFDEPRRCPNCNVVTYCDSCPICGKVLPRSSYHAWKLLHKDHVAGEGEDLLQPNDYEIHRGHIKERELPKRTETMKERISYQKKETFREEKQEDIFEHHRNDARIPYHKSQQSISKRPQAKGKNLLSWLAIIVAIMIGSIAVLGRIDYDTAFLEGTSYDAFMQIGSIPDNNGEIQVIDHTYYEDNNIITIQNLGDRTFTATFILYDDDGNEISWHENLFVLPHEKFQISLNSEYEAYQYEFQQTHFTRMVTDAPSFDYQVYNDYGTYYVDGISSLGNAELLELINFLYEAGKMSPDEFDQMSTCYIELEDGSEYSIYINEKEVEGYYYDAQGDTSDSFHFKIGETMIQGVPV